MRGKLQKTQGQTIIGLEREVIKINLLKVLNPDKSKELIDSGFKYTTEYLNGKRICVFMMSDDLIKFVHKSFAKKDYFIDKTMNF